MTSIRRAIAWASVGQYGVLAVNFVAMLVMARMLTPAEFGIASLGGAILGIAEAIRELAGGNYIISERDLTNEKTRSTTTVNLLITVAVVVLLMLLAAPLAEFFAAPALVPYLSVALLGYALGPVLYPQHALLSRDMAFDKIAMVNVFFSVAGVSASILLAYLGFSSLSLAWGAVASSLTATVLCLAIRRDLSIYRPTLAMWRTVVGFGAYSSVSAVLGRINEALPMLIFGKLLDTGRMAIMHRAALLCLFPEKLIFAAVGQVALPEFSRQARQGADLKVAYLQALSLISVVHWPFMIMLAILARPIVALVLGNQWLEAAPLVSIVGPALVFSLPIALQYPVLIASGGVHLLPRLLVLQTIVMAVALAGTAPYGLHTAAFSMLVAIPLNALLSVLAVRSRIPFCWSELGAVLTRSAAVTLIAAAAPIALVLNVPGEVSLPLAVAAAMLAAAGWIVGLVVTRHSFWQVLTRTAVVALR